MGWVVGGVGIELGGVGVVGGRGRGMAWGMDYGKYKRCSQDLPVVILLIVEAGVARRHGLELIIEVTSQL